MAFAAAAIGTPALLLADEPTAAARCRRRARRWSTTMRSLVELGATLVVTSHDDAVIDAADHVVRLRDGRVVLT